MYKRQWFLFAALLLICTCSLFAQLQESFEGTFPPPYWTVGADEWEQSDLEVYDGIYSASIASSTTGRLITPLLSMDGSDLIFYAKRTGYQLSFLDIQYSTDMITWDSLNSIELTMSFDQYTIDLSSLSGDYYIAISKFSSGNAYVDLVSGPALSSANFAYIDGMVLKSGSMSPLGGATITAGPFSTTSNFDGTYSLALSPDAYNVTCELDGYETESQFAYVTAGQTQTLTFMMSPAWVPGFTEGFENGFPPVDWTTDPNTWQESMMPYEGSYAATIGNGVEGMLMTPKVTILPGDKVRFYAKRMGFSLAFITIRYSDDGVNWTDLEQHEVASSYIQFESDLSSIAGDKYLAFYKSANGDVHMDNVQGPTFAATNVATIDGMVLKSGSMSPLGGATITAGPFSTTSDFSGHFSMTVDPDAYNVTCELDGYQTDPQFVNLTAGQTQSLTFMMSPAWVPGFTEGFENGFPPVDWTTDPNTWQESMMPYEGSYAATIGNGVEGMLMTPKVTILPGDKVRFFAKRMGFSLAFITIRYSDDGVNWTDLEQHEIASTYAQFESDLSSIAGDKYLAFYKSANGDVHMDNVQGPAFAATNVATIDGMVLKSGSMSPLGGATITAGPFSTTSNFDGTYSLTVDPDAYNVTCELDGYQTDPQFVSLTAGQTQTLTFMMSPAWVPGFTEGFENGFPPVDWTTDPNTWQESMMPYEGSYAATIGNGVEGMLMTPKVTILPGDKVRFFAKRMGFSLAFITIRYSDDGVNWTDLEQHEIASTYAQFESDLSSIAGDKYLAFYKSANGDVHMDNVQGPAFATTNVATIDGMVLKSGSMSPLGGATITAGPFSTTSNFDGTYSLTVDPDAYNVTCELDGYQTDPQFVSLTAGQTQTLTFMMSPAWVPGFTEGFENGFPPVDWTTDPNTWQESMMPYEGSYAATIGNGVEGMLMTPKVTILPGDKVRFYAKRMGFSLAFITIRYSDDGVNWTDLEQHEIASTYAQFESDLSSIAGDKYLAFYKSANGDVHMDNVQGPAFAATNLSTIDGMVLSAGSMAPLGGATITAGPFSTTSDLNGHFSMTVDPDAYNVTCELDGYQTDPQFVNLTAGQTQILTFMMSPAWVPGFTEDFENSFPPANWTVDPGTWSQGFMAYQGAYCATIGNGVEGMLMTPKLNIIPGDKIRFFAKRMGFSLAFVTIRYSDDGVNWTDLEQHEIASTYAQFESDLSAIAGEKYLAFYKSANGDVNMDDVEGPAFATLQTGTLEGVVTSQSNSQPIQNAEISIDGQTVTTNTMGFYTITLNEGTYSGTCSATGYHTANLSNILINPGQTTTLDIQMDDAWTQLLNQQFDDGAYPADWTVLNAIGSTGWTYNPGLGLAGSGCAEHYYYDESGDDWIISPAIDLTGYNAAQLKFWEYEIDGSYADTHEVAISTDMQNWTVLYGIIPPDCIWQEVVLDLSAYLGQTIYVGFHYFGTYADAWYIDSVALEAEPMNSNGTVCGMVLCGGSSQPLADATIICDGETVATSAADGSYSFSYAPGSYVVGCLLDGYIPQTEYVSLTAGQTETIDFIMPLLVLNPPQNLQISSLGLMTWDPPIQTDNRISGLRDRNTENQTRDFDEYQIHFEDGGIITTTTLCEYQLTGLTNGQTYTYGVSAAYDEGVSDTLYCEFTLQIELNQPENFTATLQDYNNIMLDWDQPAGTGGTFFHHLGYNGNGIGTGGVADLVTAARFDTDDLADYYSNQLSSMRFVISFPDFSLVELKVWEGGSFGDPGTEVYSADVTADVIVDDWTTHELTTPITLQEGNEYWLGYVLSATANYPAGCDDGPIVADKGGWVNIGNGWVQLPDLNASLQSNWCIEGVCTDCDGTTSRLATTSTYQPRPLNLYAGSLAMGRTQGAHAQDNTRALNGYIIHRNGQLYDFIWEPSITTYLDEGLDVGDYTYSIQAVYENGYSDPTDSITVAVTLPAPANFNAVSQGPAQSSVMCNWQEPTVTRGLTGYRVYRDDVEVGTTNSLFFVDLDVPSGTYTYHATAIYNYAMESVASNNVTIDHTEAPTPLVPAETALCGNYPNPFNPTTQINFALHEASKVSIVIYNIKGEKVKTLINQTMEAAQHAITWNGTDDTNRAVSSGIYFYKMQTSRYTSTKKMIMMK